MTAISIDRAVTHHIGRASRGGRCRSSFSIAASIIQALVRKSERVLVAARVQHLALPLSCLPYEIIQICELERRGLLAGAAGPGGRCRPSASAHAAIRRQR